MLLQLDLVWCWISLAGDILATGIATATAFVGIGSLLTELDADNIAYGTIGTERIPVVPSTYYHLI